MKEFTATVFLNVEDKDLEVEVKARYIPAEPRSIWSPGYPEDVEILSAMIGPHEIPQWDYIYIENELQEKALEAIHKQQDYDREDYADYLYECRRDRQYH